MDRLAAPRACPPLLLALLLCACGGKDGGATRDGGLAVDTVDGVETVRLPGETDAPVRWRVDTVAVVGADPGAEGGVQFGSVPAEFGIAADGHGRVFVLDRTARRVFAFDSAGTLLAEFGSRGQGPGEFERPAGMGAGPGDSLWVYDMALGRITRYSADGSRASTLPVSFGGGAALPSLHPLPDGHVQQARTLSGMGGETSRTSDLVLRFDGTGAVRDTLWTSPRPPSRTVRLPNPGGGVVMTTVDQRFAPELHWTVLADGRVVVADSAPYLLHLVGLDGTRERRIVRDLPPREVTARDRRQARRGFRGGIEDEPALQKAREELTYAEVVPRITDLAAAPDGGFWVGVSLEEPGEAERIDIYGPRGRAEASGTGIPFPHAFVTPDVLARVVRTELGVSRVLLYRAARAGPDR